MRILVVIFFAILCGHSNGQNYIEYQKVFNRIDEDVLKENHDIAMQRLDSIFNEYEFIYANHCIKALQICCFLNDSINANKWLTKSLKQGVPLWIIRANDLTRSLLKYNITQQSIQKHDSLYSIYKTSINNTIVKQIDSLFTIDQKYTVKVNDGFFLFRHTVYGLQWLKNNKKQFQIINKIIESHGFPGERLIGLPSSIEDSSATSKSVAFYGPGLLLRDHRAYIMLIHYYSNPRKGINDKLYKNLISGYLRPYQYGALNDFMTTWGKKKFGDYQYYNVWHKDKDPQNLDNINLRRFSIGLNSFEQQQQNNLIMREKRKNKTANKEIILE